MIAVVVVGKQVNECENQPYEFAPRIQPEPSFELFLSPPLSSILYSILCPKQLRYGPASCIDQACSDWFGDMHAGARLAPFLSASREMAYEMEQIALCLRARRAGPRCDLHLDTKASSPAP